MACCWTVTKKDLKKTLHMAIYFYVLFIRFGLAWDPNTYYRLKLHLGF